MTTPSNETNTTNLLDALTHAIFKDQNDLVDALFDQYKVPKGSLDNLFELIYQLRGVFTPADPSEEYLRSLKQELMGVDDTLLARMRYLPARVQVAAGLAVIAGFLLLTRRRITSNPLGEASSEYEIPVLQQ